MLPLESPRLVLRRFRPEDVDLFLDYRNDVEVARYQGWETVSRSEAQTFVALQSLLDTGLPGEWSQIAISLKGSAALIGDCALRIHSPDVRQATIGITLAPSHQGRGFATEALSCLLDHLFLQLRLHRVVADTDPQNVRSWRLLERLGMRREGYLRQKPVVQGGLGGRVPLRPPQGGDGSGELGLPEPPRRTGLLNSRPLHLGLHLFRALNSPFQSFSAARRISAPRNGQQM